MQAVPEETDLSHSIQIKKARVLVRPSYPDSVELVTTRKSPWPADGKDGKLGLTFTTGPGLGADYVRQKFPGIPVEVVEIKDPRKAE